MQIEKQAKLNKMKSQFMFSNSHSVASSASAGAAVSRETQLAKWFPDAQDYKQFVKNKRNYTK